MRNDSIWVDSQEIIIAAGKSRVVYGYSRMLTILSNSADDKIHVGIGEQTPVPLKAGIQYELPQGDHFESVTFKNEAAVETTVEFILSIGLVRDNRLVIAGSVFATLAAQAEGPTAVPTYGSIATLAGPKEIIASNDNRVGYIIENPEANAETIYVGYDSNVTATNYSYSVKPGAVGDADKFRGDIYVYCAAVQNIMRTEFA